jgi:acid phosphatase (class A)
MFTRNLVLAASLVMSGCAGLHRAAPPQTAVPEIAPGILAGYLPKESLPDSLALLPAPPVQGTSAFAADQEAYKSTRVLNGKPRWMQAAQDAVLKFPATAGEFACAAGIPIDESSTPHLYQLLRRTFTDGAMATYAAKNHYQRRRPFMEFNDATCYPQDDESLRKDGSYPSGHSAIGWTWALVLIELVPERQNEILKRGYEFGQSRVICGAHWQSDVDEGRVIAAATVARLHGDATFAADLQNARRDTAAAKQANLGPSRDCAVEADAVAVKPN